MTADLDLVDDLMNAGARQRRAEAEQRKVLAAQQRGLPKAKPRVVEMDGQEAVISWLRRAGCTTSRNINELHGNESDPHKRARFWMKLVKTGVTKSFPDITALLPDGRSVFIEMKAKGKKPTDEQAALHARLEAQGHIVVWGTDIWTVQAALYQRGVVIGRTGGVQKPTARAE